MYCLLTLLALLFAGITTASATGLPQKPSVYFQAHRGGMDEAPENTLPAFRHAWMIPGAVPEVDLRTTSDGVIVCIHDETPARTTTAPPPWASMNIRDIPYAKLSQWDAGCTFDSAYENTPVPALRDLFDVMNEAEDRQLYLDVKEVCLDALIALIREYGFEKRVLFVHGAPETCLKLSTSYQGARTMTWLSGTPRRIRQSYETLRKSGFAGISQLQFHLHGKTDDNGIEYWLDEGFIRQAAAELNAVGAALQLRPFTFDTNSLGQLIDLGIIWYVTDSPKAFYQMLPTTKDAG